jgi:uncharacterized membrane protein
MQECFVTQCHIVAPSLSPFVCFPWGHHSSFLFEVSAALVVVVFVVVVVAAAAAAAPRWLSLFFAVFHVILIYSNYIYFDPNFESIYSVFHLPQFIFVLSFHSEFRF